VGQDEPFNNPFAVLVRMRQRLRRGERDVGDAGEPPKPPPSAVAGTDGDDPGALFRREVGPVAPMDRSNVVPANRRPRQLPPRSDDDEVMAELADLVSGRGAFALDWSDEHIEGLAPGIDRRLLKRLRQGAYSIQGHLDLHGRTRQEARVLVERFISERRARGDRCVLIVHGRGLHSPDRIPVLKDALSWWLARGRIGRAVLAFCSARPVDGGLGAVYVLLRK